MRSATFVQAFQYWLKLTAIAVPALVLLAGLAGRRRARPRRPGAAGRSARRRRCGSTPPSTSQVARAPSRSRWPRRPHRARPSSRGCSGSPSGSTVVFPAGAAVPHVDGLEAATGDSLGAAAVRRRRAGAPAVRDVRPGAGDVPRHDGPAARAGPLLHEPRRRGGPAHDAGRCSRLLGAFYLLPARVRRARPALRAGAAADRPHRRRRARAARARCSAASAARCSRRCSSPARSRRSCRRRPGCWCRRPGVLVQDVLRGHGRATSAARPWSRRPSPLAARAARRRPAGRRRWSGWPSPSRRRRSARCWCSASGGAG